MAPASSSRSPPLYNEKHVGSANGRRRTGLRSRGTQLLAVKFGWVVLVIWFEVGEFFSSLSSCRFPDAALKSKRYIYSPTPTHVVLIADPHVSHPVFSYPSDSNPWMNALRQAFDELFMRKSWNIVMRLGRIDAVVMLGDMLDWGRGVMDEEEYKSYHNTFRSIFQLPPSIPIHFVPGNHDIPLGPHRLFSPHARDRYSRYFSEPNHIVDIANHSLVLLDSVGLVEEDYRRYAAEMQFGEWDGMEGGVIEFVKEAAEKLPGPNILLSHIPLARPERSQCGPHREHGRIQKGAGPGYQNLLGSETSRFLLDALKPIVVFSGDDHDYCEHTHPGHIREVTVKSFSSSTGIRRPGLQLLSLIPTPEFKAFPPEPTYADRPCFLPDQAGVYSRVYLPFICLTIIYIFGTNIRQAWIKWNAIPDKTEKQWNEKNRLSPNLSAEPTRKYSDRPVPLTLPSRRSTSQLQGLSPHGSTFSSRSHITSRQVSADQLARSAPGSPYLSPRPSFADEEAEINLDTPTMSRRSSFIYMNGHSEKDDPHRTPRVMSEPSSYFAPRDTYGQTSNAGLGLGLATPTGLHPQPGHPSSPGLRRTSSSASPYQSHSPTPPLQNAPFSGRRATMPRLLSSFLPNDRDSKKDRSTRQPLPPTPSSFVPVLSLSDGSSGSKVMYAWERLKGFMRWVWKMRNSVLVRSCWEVWGVAWVVAAVWVIVNGLFFLG